MQAIRTRYIGPTNTRDARVQAKCEAKTIYVTWDDSLNIDENHKLAAIKLASQLGWHNEFVGGVFDRDYYWVMVNTPQSIGFNMDKHEYEVIVGNIGTVYSGSSLIEATTHFNEYVEQSKTRYGKAGGEDVTIMSNGEIWKEHNGINVSKQAK